MFIRGACHNTGLDVKDDFWESVLPFHRVGARDPTQVRLAAFYPLSHPISLVKGSYSVFLKVCFKKQSFQSL